LDERVKATEEACKRQALDDFMHDIRVDERSYVRESKSLNGSKKTMVMQERVFFRNIPLSNWIEREMLIEDGLETRQLTAESMFTPPALPTTIETPLAIARLLQEVKGASPKPVPQPMAPKPVVVPQVIEPVLLTQHATAFGAQ
jgi:CRISPR/Cas system CSM-associated protein Csm3 (group 7 of RAMP superfamily)